MKKARVLVGLILCFAMIFAMAGCGEKKDPCGGGKHSMWYHELAGA